MIATGRAAVVAMTLSAFVLPTDSVLAAAPQKLSEKQQEALKGAVAGARVFANCHSMSGAEWEEYRFHLEGITAAINKMADPGAYAKLIAEGRDIGDYVACAAMATTLRLGGLVQARRLNFQLTGGLFVDRPHDLYGDMYRIEKIATYVGVDERCKFQDDATRQKFVALFEATSKKIAEQTDRPEQTFSAFAGLRKDVREDTASGCDSAYEILVVDAYVDANVLGRQLAVVPAGDANSSK